MNQDYYYQGNHRSVLASLRSLIPPRQLNFTDSLRLAELQANRLLELTAIDDEPTQSEVVSGLPHIRVTYRDIPTSGLSYWNGQDWIVCLNKTEPATRQRFTLFHEYKHIVDHGRTDRLYRNDEQAEKAADYFAGCALMPKRLMKRAWGELVQRPSDLGRRFDVSPRAISVRLAQIGLGEPIDRCDHRLRSPRQPRSGPYYRLRSLDPSFTLPTAGASS